MNEDHDLSAFDCQKASLNEWLVRHALNAAKSSTAQTHVWSENGRVVAYYSLAAHQIVKNELPSKFSRGSPDFIPAVLLAKLALDVSLQGEGWGAELLADALERVLSVTGDIAVRYVVVDAIDDEAARFYEKYGFIQCEPAQNRLVRKTSDIARDLRAASPG